MQSYAQRARLMTNIHAVRQGAACSSGGGGGARPAAVSECAASGGGGGGGDDRVEGGGSRRDEEEVQSPSKVSKTAAAAKGDVKSSLKANDKKRSLRRL